MSNAPCFLLDIEHVMCVTRRSYFQIEFVREIYPYWVPPVGRKGAMLLDIVPV